jgi:hypothetical protein
MPPDTAERRPRREGGAQDAANVTASVQRGIYAAHAPAYHKMGFSPVLLPPRRKKEPPKGWTGRGAPMASRADVQAWAEEQPDGNIAVRLPPWAVGIDADPYKSPQAEAAWEELVAELGPLPADAPWSTSRDDGKSGIRWLSIPPGTELAGTLPGDCGEVIQHHHRYIVAPPSIHPDTGKTYRWTGERQWIPDARKLPPLPPAWLSALSGGQAGTQPGHPPFQQPADGRRYPVKPGYTHPDVDTLAQAGMQPGTQHDQMRDVVAQLVGQGLSRPAVEAVWWAIVSKTTLHDPDRWTRDYFNSMYDSAADKFGTRPRASSGTKETKETKETEAETPVAGGEIYRGILGEITETAGPTTEADPVGVYDSLMAGTGVLIGRGPYVRIGNIRHPLLIWPLLMGRTGSGRKGEATSIAEIFLRAAKLTDLPAVTVGGLSSGEGLIERIRDPDGQGGTDDKRLLVIEPEFTSVMARAKREGSTLAQVQRQAWDGRGLVVLNRKQLKASASHIAVIGHAAPREFRMRMAEADMAGGTYNRYLPLYVERSKLLPVPEAVPDAEVLALACRLAVLIDHAAALGCIQLGKEATSLWSAELYPEFTELDDDDNQAYSEFTRRAAPYCLRIAGLHAALDGRNLISKDDLAAAGALVRYSIASARYVLGSLHRDPRMDRLTRAIAEAGDAGLSRTEISELFNRNLPKVVLDELLADLLDTGRYEEIKDEAGERGRPSVRYRRTSFV